MGCCSGHGRGTPRPSARKHPNDVESMISNSEYSFHISTPKSLWFSDRRLPYTNPKLTTVNISEHISPHIYRDLLSTCSVPSLSRNDIRQQKRMANDVSEAIQSERFRAISISVTQDDNSTSPAESEEQFYHSEKIKHLPNPNKQQPQDLGVHVTNLTSEVIWVKRLEDTDDPEIKALITQLVAFLSKKTELESHDGKYLWKGKQNIISEVTDSCNDSTKNFVSVNGGKRNDSSRLSKTHDGDSESMSTETDDEIVKKRGSTLSDEEEMKILENEVILNRKKSLDLTRALKIMPSLSQTLIDTDDLVHGHSDESPKNQDIFDLNWDIFDLKNMASEVDKLDHKIDKYTTKLNSLRKKVLAILTDKDHPGKIDEEGGKVSFISTEKEINRLKELKNKAIHYRETIFSELQSKLILQMSRTAGVVSSAGTNFPVFENFEIAKVPSARRKSVLLSES